ncbi:hypothetical protein ACFRSX_32640 [Streptomyces goshikiensis]|uniref:hypothetical protein n=1 Tax=Streptomyces TaxID=1883 RepID=UPI000C27734A|nr:hypothetical protein [Streptomyces sp. CB02120-2]PJN14533.1 hypothetical protein CG724_33100 [Streptomyces sp. CB02120-2]
MPFPLASLAGSPTHTAGPAPAWPAAAAAELSRLAELLAEADVTAVPAPGFLAIPGLAAGPGDTVGIRVRTISNPPEPCTSSPAAASPRAPATVPSPTSTR